jgi:aldose 1-epimerase
MAKWLKLDRDDYRLQLLPECGGAIGAFSWRHPKFGWVDLMRRAPKGAETASVGETACFPLVPFANRVRNSTFAFRGRTVDLPAGTIGRHYLHGMGWLRGWQSEQTAPESAVLRFRNEPGNWPYAFETSQEFRLEPSGLTIRLWAVNRSAEPMPFGFGLHPYFPRTPRCEIEADVAGWWEVDADVLPTRLVDVPAAFDPRRGLRVDTLTCDNPYSGWRGAAAIRWPEHSTCLTMAATAPMGVLYLYVPAGEDYFCLEPASNLTDAFNLAAAGRTDTGMIVLDPGAEVTASVDFGATEIVD